MPDPAHCPAPAAAGQAPAVPALPAGGHGRLRALVLGGLLLTSAIYVAFAGYQLSHSRDQYEQRAELTAHNLANATAHTVAANVEKIDLAVTAIADDLEHQLRQARPGASGTSAQQLDLQRAATMIASQASYRPELEGIRVTDETGMGFLGPALARRGAVSFADREWFSRQRDEANLGLFMSRPIKSKIHGQWIVSFSRRYNWPDGRFAGAVTASVTLAYFDRILAAVDAGPQGAVALRTAQFELMARHPHLGLPSQAVGSVTVANELRQLADAGTVQALYRSTETSDGVTRTTAFRRLAVVPILVTVGLAPDDYLLPWEAERRQVVGLCASALLLNVLAARLLLRAFGENRRAQQRIALLARCFERSGEAIIVADASFRIVDVNPAFERQCGFTTAEVVGRPARIVLAAERLPRDQIRLVRDALEGSGEWRGETWCPRRDAAPYPAWLSASALRDEHGVVTHFVATVTNLSDLKDAEERLRHLADHDMLTRLPNRQLLERRTEEAMAEARRSGDQLAMLLVNLDRFKGVNELLGHQAGDALLQAVAQRLQATVGSACLAARVGGDEFALLVTGAGRNAAVSAAALADQLLAALAGDYPIDGQPLRCTPSIGIAVFPADGDDTEALLRNADAAVHHAKANGRNNRQFFSPAFGADAAERLALENGLRTALERHELSLHYQPQVDLHSGETCGVEALLRWTHPELGAVSPLKFIAVAEDTGQIGAIGAWVLDEALRQVALWRAGGHPRLRVAVNVSARQLYGDDIVTQVDQALARHGLPGDALELEVTESAAMEDPRHTAALLRRLREIGVAVAIDDFGTGYSSLSYLKQLPLSCLKLDRSFVRDIEHDPNDAAISAATIQLAHNLGLAVVAEGVESAAQLEFLHGLDCDIVQGYHIGRPMPAEDCGRLLAQRRDGDVPAPVPAPDAHAPGVTAGAARDPAPA